MKTIYVPSKGRPKSFFLRKLVQQKYDGRVVVLIEEPDLQSYLDEGYLDTECSFEFRVLRHLNRGVAFARNRILQIAQEMGDEWIWMIDDDIKQIGQYSLCEKPKRSITTIRNTLSEAFDIISTTDNVVAGSLEVAFNGYWYARTAKVPGVLNHLISGVTLLNVPKLAEKKIWYCDDLRSHEDLDLYLQILSVGYNTLRLRSFFFDTPDLKQYSGGNTEDYLNGADVTGGTNVLNFWKLQSLRHKDYKGNFSCKIDYKNLVDEIRMRGYTISPRSVK